MDKDELINMMQKAKSTEPLKVSDLIEMLKPFEDYYVYDPGCHYCGDYLRLTKDPTLNLKRHNDIISFYEKGDGVIDFEEYLKERIARC